MIEDLKTYKNLNGAAMLRKCQNCKHWAAVSEKETNLGYCKLRPLYFAHTLQKSVYLITKDFYLCEEHLFRNEEILAEQSEKVSILESLKNRK